MSVHEGGLFNGEGVHLRVDCPKEDAGGPYGDKFQYHFHLFYLSHGRDDPRVVSVSVGSCIVIQDCSLVKTPGHLHDRSIASI